MDLYRKKKNNSYFAHIWLDDIRTPDVPSGETVVWVKDYTAFTKQVVAFGENISDCIVHFDHDLGGERDGYDCAKFLISWCIDNEYPAPDYDIQSANPIGRENIDSLFKSYWKVFNKKPYKET